MRCLKRTFAGEP